MRPLRALSARIFIVYFVILGGTSYVALRYFSDAIKPAVRQTMEELLVDEANLLASVLEQRATPERMLPADMAAALEGLGHRAVHADIYSVKKTAITERVYVTDRSGIVVFDSGGRDVGKDYSRWNDVARTLKGGYGSRSTHEPSANGASTLYVAAPIVVAGTIAGSVTVAKPVAEMDPFLDLARARVLRSGGALFAGALMIGLLSAVLLSRSISRLVDYAKRVSTGGRATLPKVGGELGELALAIESMRMSLQGKEYVEKTIQTIAHELKSPLTAVVGAAELLEGDLAAEERTRFATQIGAEARRMHAIVERILELAVLERRQAPRAPERIAAASAVEHALRQAKATMDARALVARVEGTGELYGERLLIEQALRNLVDNAAEFATPGSTIVVRASSSAGSASLSVANEGPGIPDFAEPRVFERFYSLPRPGTGKRSTGLGLTFVREVADLHGGSITLRNVEGGVSATLTLPSYTSSS